jgi:membrane-associated phospholipid phosphatase
MVPAPGRAQSRSEEKPPPPVFTLTDALVLAAGVGGSIALMRVDSRIAHRLAADRYQDDPTLKRVADLAALANEKSLFAASLLTYGIARLAGAGTTGDIAWHTAEAIFISGATATLIRGALGRSRPFVTADDDAFDYSPGKGFSDLAYRAYPSIHAGASFATAAALTAETWRHSRRVAWIVGPVSYSLAALPGLARMYDDKHWASDVLMGAAFGAVVGWATVRYHHARPGNQLDRIFLALSPGIAPDGQLAIAVRGSW